MKKILIFFIFFGYSFLSAQTQTFNWAKKIGSTGADAGLDICTDLLGNVYTTGTFYGTVDFDPGPNVYNISAGGSFANTYVLKLNAQGNFVWAAGFLSLSNNVISGSCIRTDVIGNVYVGGSFSATVDFDPGPGSYTVSSQAGLRQSFLCKLNSNGSFMWEKTLGGGLQSEPTLFLDIDASGKIYTAANFDGLRDFDPGPGTYTFSSLGFTDVFVGAFTNSGNLIWAKQIGGTDEDGSSHIISSGISGDILVSGGFNTIIDFDPGPAISSFTSNGLQDGFVCRLSNSGNYIWAAQMGGVGNDINHGSKFDVQDNVLSVGSFISIVDFDPGPSQFTLSALGIGNAFITKLSANGGFIFAKQFVGIMNNSHSVAYSIIPDQLGNLYIEGVFTNSPIDFDPSISTFILTPFGSSSDIYITKLDPNGNFIWAKQFGGTMDTHGHVLCGDGAGNLYVTGRFKGTSDFDPGANTFTLSSINNLNDAFIFKLSLCADVPLNTSDYFVCAGNSATLSATSSGSLTWYASQTSTSAIASGTIFITPVLSTGTYTYYAQASTCTLAGSRAPIIFNVAALPIVHIVSNPSILCIGNTATLSVSGADTFSWQAGASNVTLAVSPIIISTYTAIGTNTTTGCANTATLLLNVSPKPTLLITSPQGTVCAGSKITLTANGANTYTWNNASQNTTISITPTITTSFTLSGTNTITGCSNITSTLVNVVPCLDIIERNFLLNIKLFPNPFHDYIILHADEEVILKIYTCLGEKIAEEKVGIGEQKIDLINYSSGVYFMEVSNSYNFKILKIIKVE